MLVLNIQMLIKAHDMLLKSAWTSTKKECIATNNEIKKIKCRTHKTTKIKGLLQLKCKFL